MKFDDKTNIKTIFFQNTPCYSRNSGPVLLFKTTERFHSRGQHLCKFMRTKENLCIRKEFNSQRIFLEHRHVLHFIVLEHQYGRRDVICVEYTQIEKPFPIAYQFDKGIWYQSSNTLNSDTVRKKWHNGGNQRGNQTSDTL